MPDFFASVLLSTNLRHSFQTVVWTCVLVSPIHESTAVSNDTYPRFFWFGTTIYESTPLFSNRCVDPCLCEPYLRIYGYIRQHICQIFLLQYYFLQIYVNIFIQVCEPMSWWPLSTNLGVSTTTHMPDFFASVLLSTNLRQYFRTGVWTHVLVTPIYEYTGISIDTYARFFCFGTAI